jgi:diguanylate cyclase (GGDEF)-like protein
MPMHLWVGPTGHILHAGKTLQKLFGGTRLEGALLFDLVQFRRPRQLTGLDQLLRLNCAAVQVTLSGVDDMSLKGVVLALPAGTGVLINLSFGISVQEAVRRFDLDIGDFAATDLAVEMLFLIEANSAVIAETQSLNHRLRQSKSDAEHRALTDTLTGLNNRRAMDIALSDLVVRPGPRGFGLMHLDLDHFKAVNDTLGHAAGDHVLLKVAGVLQSETRAGDVVCRVGGDEFVLLIKDCNDTNLLSRIARRIIAKLEEPVVFNGQDARISASIGITLSSLYDTLEVDKILSDADVATYTSKHAGRAQHTFHAPPSLA